MKEKCLCQPWPATAFISVLRERLLNLTGLGDVTCRSILYAEEYKPTKHFDCMIRPLVGRSSPRLLRDYRDDCYSSDHFCVSVMQSAFHFLLEENTR